MKQSVYIFVTFLLSTHMVLGSEYNNLWEIPDNLILVTSQNTDKNLDATPQKYLTLPKTQIFKNHNVNKRNNDALKNKDTQSNLKKQNIQDESDKLTIRARALTKKENASTENMKEAVELYQKAIDLGNTTAMNNLGRIYAEGNPFVQKNRNKAMDLYRKSIKGGNIFAMNNLACLYISNEVYLCKAVDLLIQSLEKGNKGAKNNLLIAQDILKKENHKIEETLKKFEGQNK